MLALPAGLLNLEQLLRQFLISKETLSVRMLDESQDPTPLLKEIRNDKTATIIVDANATMSHIILERVRRGTSTRARLCYSHTGGSPVSSRAGSKYLGLQERGKKRKETQTAHEKEKN